MEKEKILKFILCIPFLIAFLLSFIFIFGYSTTIAGWIIIVAIVISAFWLLFFSEKKTARELKVAISDKYRVYLTIILTIIALLSILLLSQKAIDIFPQIIVVTVLTVFVAITTYSKKFYPYSVIFASLLLVVVYAIISMPEVLVMVVVLIYT